MTPIVAKFFNFQRSTDGASVVYRGVGPDNSVVEVHQGVGDLDVMLVLIASLLEKSAGPPPDKDAAHTVVEAELVSAEEGVVIAFKSPPGVTRRFRLSRGQAANLSSDLKRAAFNVVE